MISNNDVQMGRQINDWFQFEMGIRLIEFARGLLNYQALKNYKILHQRQTNQSC